MVVLLSGLENVIYLTNLNILLLGQLLQINIRYATLFLILKILCGIVILITVMLFFTLLFRTVLLVRGKFSDGKSIVESNISFYGNLLNVDASYDLKLSEIYLRIRLFRFCIYKRLLERSGKERSTEKPQKSKKDEGKKNFGLSLFSFQEWIGLGREVVIRFFRIFQKRSFTGKLRIGLGDPASTGVFMGAYYSLKSLIRDFEDIFISPNFFQKEIKGEIALAGSIRLIKLIPMVIFTYRKILSRKKKLKAGGRT
ncbi:MAG: DUF2953 domain-containing protein [Candidatus Marinimicrobia bacterium]|nr:DUF2953 domain-containing protein [Candidatus Neomarinimicrobiota bacterium]